MRKLPIGTQISTELPDANSGESIAKQKNKNKGKIYLAFMIKIF